MEGEWQEETSMSQSGVSPSMCIQQIAVGCSGMETFSTEGTIFTSSEGQQWVPGHWKKYSKMTGLVTEE